MASGADPPDAGGGEWISVPSKDGHPSFQGLYFGYVYVPAGVAALVKSGKLTTEGIDEIADFYRSKMPHLPTPALVASLSRHMWPGLIPVDPNIPHLIDDYTEMYGGTQAATFDYMHVKNAMNTAKGSRPPVPPIPEAAPKVQEPPGALPKAPGILPKAPGILPKAAGTQPAIPTVQNPFAGVAQTYENHQPVAFGDFAPEPVNPGLPLTPIPQSDEIIEVDMPTWANEPGPDPTPSNTPPPPPPPGRPLMADQEGEWENWEPANPNALKQMNLTMKEKVMKWLDNHPHYKPDPESPGKPSTRYRNPDYAAIEAPIFESIMDYVSSLRAASTHSHSHGFFEWPEDMLSYEQTIAIALHHLAPGWCMFLPNGKEKPELLRTAEIMQEAIVVYHGTTCMSLLRDICKNGLKPSFGTGCGQQSSLYPTTHCPFPMVYTATTMETASYYPSGEDLTPESFRYENQKADSGGEIIARDGTPPLRAVLKLKAINATSIWKKPAIKGNNGQKGYMPHSLHCEGIYFYAVGPEMASTKQAHCSWDVYDKFGVERQLHELALQAGDVVSPTEMFGHCRVHTDRLPVDITYKSLLHERIKRRNSIIVKRWIHRLQATSMIQERCPRQEWIPVFESTSHSVATRPATFQTKVHRVKQTLTSLLETPDHLADREIVEALAAAGGLWDNETDPDVKWSFNTTTKEWFRTIEDKSTGIRKPTGHRVKALDLDAKIKEGKGSMDPKRVNALHYKRERKEYNRLLRIAMDHFMIPLPFDFYGQNKGGYPKPQEPVEPNSRYDIVYTQVINGLPNYEQRISEPPPPPPPRGAGNSTSKDQTPQRGHLMFCGHYSNDLRMHCDDCKKEFARQEQATTQQFADIKGTSDTWQMNTPYGLQQVPKSDQQLAQIQKARDQQIHRNWLEQVSNASQGSTHQASNHQQPEWKRFTTWQESTPHSQPKKWNENYQNAGYGHKRKSHASSSNVYSNPTVDYREKEKEKWHNPENQHSGWVDFKKTNYEKQWKPKQPAWQQPAWQQDGPAYKKSYEEKNTAASEELPHGQEQQPVQQADEQPPVIQVTLVNANAQMDRSEEEPRDQSGHDVVNKRKNEEVPQQSHMAPIVNKTGKKNIHQTAPSKPVGPNVFTKGEAIMGTADEFDTKIAQALQGKGAAHSASNHDNMGNVTQDVPAPTSESHTVPSASSSSTAVRTNYPEQIVACLQQGEMSNEQVEKIAKVLMTTKDNKNEEE